MDSTEKIAHIAAAIRRSKDGHVRTFSVIMDRCGYVSKKSAFALLKSAKNRASLMELVGDLVEDIEFSPSRGYEASGSGPFGRYSSRRAQYVGAAVHLRWKSTQTQPLPDSSPLPQPPAAPTAHAE